MKISDSLPIYKNMPSSPIQGNPNNGQYSEEELAAVKKSAQEFEALFTEIMLKSMRESVPKSDLIDGGNGEDIFRSMLDSEYSKIMAGQKHFGMAQAIEEQLLGSIAPVKRALDQGNGIKAYQKVTE